MESKYEAGQTAIKLPGDPVIIYWVLGYIGFFLHQRTLSWGEFDCFLDKNGSHLKSIQLADEFLSSCD